MSIDQPTINAVIKLAAKLRDGAEKAKRADPWAKPYAPTEEAAKRRYHQCVKARRDQLPDDATDDDHALAVAKGARDAMTYLTQRAITTMEEHRSEEVAAERSLKRLARRKRDHGRDVAAARRGLTPGQRIDQALAALSVVAAPAASQLDTDPVKGSSSPDAPKFPGDPAGRARHVAIVAAQDIERMLDDAQSRDVQEAA